MLWVKSLEALYDDESGLKIDIGKVFEYLKFGLVKKYYMQNFALDEQEIERKKTCWI